MGKEEQLAGAIVGNKLNKVKELLNDPEVNLNWRNSAGCPIFYLAALYGRADMVEYMMNECPRRNEIDFNAGNRFEMTPFFAACGMGESEAVKVMVEDWRIDVNRPDVANWTPLFRAVENGNIAIIKLILSSRREIDTARRTADGHVDYQKYKTAAELAKYHASRNLGPYTDTLSMIDRITEAYEKNPAGTRKCLRRDLGLDLRDAGGLFALSVLHSDGYLTFNDEGPHRVFRFFHMISRLPLELQMLTCHRAYGSSRDVVTSKDLEPWFRKFLAKK